MVFKITLVRNISCFIFFVCECCSLLFKFTNFSFCQYFTLFFFDIEVFLFLLVSLTSEVRFNYPISFFFQLSCVESFLISDAIPYIFKIIRIFVTLFLSTVDIFSFNVFDTFSRLNEFSNPNLNEFVCPSDQSELKYSICKKKHFLSASRVNSYSTIV